VREAGGLLVAPDGSELGLLPGAVYGANSAPLLDELREALAGAPHRT
jgi:hypothetical protein